MKYRKYYRNVTTLIISFFGLMVLESCSRIQNQQKYNIGDQVNIGENVIFILDRAVITRGRLETTYIIINNSGNNYEYTIWLNLQAKDENNSTIHQIAECGINNEGELSSGETKNLVVCWDIGKSKIIQIQYFYITAFKTDSNIVWELTI